MLDRSREPIRLTAGVASILVVALSLAIDVLSDVSVKAGVGRALTSLVLLLGGSELGRSKVTPAEPLAEDLASYTNRSLGVVKTELTLARGDAGTPPRVRRHPTKPKP